jgi:hypothetical protein
MPEKREVLGENLYVSVFILRAAPPRREMEILLKKAVGFIGMNTAGMPAKAWIYPLSDGRGGIGETICQPLVESFIVSDSWRDLGKTYIVLASCRRYSPQAVAAFLAKETAVPCEFQGWTAAGGRS